MAMEPILLDKEIFWSSFGLDPRLERAIAKLGWNVPTLVQAKAIPLALQGKDILARARTGSGKTGAYAIPILQRLVVEKEAGVSPNGIKALILVPTRELCEQILDVFTQLTHYLSNQITILRLANDQPLPIQRARLAESPDILIATPGRLVEHLNKGHVILSKSLQMLVIDEADLLLSYGCKNDIETITRHLPKIFQGFLMSATLNPEVESLKRLVLHTPAILKLEERVADTRLQQFVVHCTERDKFLLIYVMLKLKLITGKIIIFVNDINQAFRLKLFLERFSIKSAVLNSELPQNSRYHIVQQFNKGVFDLLIATDEKQNEEEDEDDEEEKFDDNDKQQQQQKQQIELNKKKTIKHETNEELDEERESSESMENDDNHQSNEFNDEESHEEITTQTNLDNITNRKDVNPQIIEHDDSDNNNSTENEESEGESDDEDNNNEEDEDDDNEDDNLEEESDVESDHSDNDVDDNDDDDHGNEDKSNETNLTENKSQNDKTIDTTESTEQNQQQKKKKKKKKKVIDNKDVEYGVTRGVDFKEVHIVINFDFPRTLKDYIHRIGRTARAGHSGIALSFVAEKEKPLLKEVEEYEAVEEGRKIVPYEFKTSIVESFRYRVENILRSVTRQDIKEARLEDIRVEILNSDRLKAHFEEHPKDLETLQHTKPLQSSRILTHLKYIPDYLLPQKESTDQIAPQMSIESENSKKLKPNQRKKGKSRTNDPLKSFSVSERQRKKRKFTEMMEDSDAPNMKETNSKRKHWRGGSKRPFKRRRFASRRKKRNKLKI